MMFRFFVVATFITFSSTASVNYGNSNRVGMNSYGSMTMSNSYGSGSSKQSEGQVIPAAIQTRHEIQFRDVPSMGTVNPTTIEVGANTIPLNIVFRSASSNLNILQDHQSSGGTVQESNSEDEPHILKHSVKKPIIQEIHEIITPSRKIVQEIQPVQEEILTIVAKNSDKEEAKQDYSTKSSSSASSYGSLSSPTTGSSQRKGY